MESKFVVRLLDANDQLLAWSTVMATARPVGGGRSCPFFAPGATMLPIERDGLAVKISVHWCDLDIARVRDVAHEGEGVAVTAGTTMSFTWIEPVWLVPGMQGVPLPGVTVGSTTVSVPIGNLLATTTS